MPHSNLPYVSLRRGGVPVCIFAVQGGTGFLYVACGFCRTVMRRLGASGAGTA